MEEARQVCQQKNGDLVKIDSEAEAVFLWKQVSGFLTHNFCHFCVGEFTVRFVGL